MENQTETARIILVGILAMLSPAAMIFGILNNYKKRMLEKENKILEKENKIQVMEREKEILRFSAVTETQERERQAFARNLHDQIIPKLSATNDSIEANIIAYGKGKGDFIKLEKDWDMIKQIITDLRGLSHDLTPPEIIKLGFIIALDHFVSRIKDGGKCNTTFQDLSTFGERPPYALADQLNIYRACLEVMNNLVKHARCTSLDVVVSKGEDHLIVTLKHNGEALTDEQVEKLTDESSGLGLRSVKARLLLLSAKIRYFVDSQKSMIEIRIPYGKS